MRIRSGSNLEYTENMYSRGIRDRKVTDGWSLSTCCALLYAVEKAERTQVERRD